MCFFFVHFRGLSLLVTLTLSHTLSHTLTHVYAGCTVHGHYKKVGGRIDARLEQDKMCVGTTERSHIHVHVCVCVCVCKHIRTYVGG